MKLPHRRQLPTAHAALGEAWQCREVTNVVAHVGMPQPDGGDLQPDNHNRPAAVALWTKGKGGLSCASAWSLCGSTFLSQEVETLALWSGLARQKVESRVEFT
jgi:hypothetical protein